MWSEDVKRRSRRNEWSEGGASSYYWLMIVGIVVFGCRQQTLCAQQTRGVTAQWEIDNLVFSQADAYTRRKQLEAKLNRELHRVEQHAELTEPQQQKLQLAGQGDINRFLSRVSAARRKMETAESDPEDVDQKMPPEIAQLRREFVAGLFNDSSLFQKVLARTLTPAQIARMDRRSDPQFYSAIRSYMLSATKPLDLSAAQSEALEGLLIESIPRTGMATDYQNYLIAYRVSKIPEDRFAEILDETQLEALQSTLSHARALEPFLRRQGWVEDDDHDQPKGDDDR